MLKQIRKGALLSLVMAAMCLSVAPADTADAKDLVLKGDEKCTACHNEGTAPQLLGIGKTMHGTRADGRTPTCTSCHGESAAHADSKGKPDVVFGRKGASPANAQNDACLGCHQKESARHLWAGSVHDTRDVTCASCHNSHSGHDKALDKATQPDVCYACHASQRAKANKPSHHPVVEGPDELLRLPQRARLDRARC